MEKNFTHDCETCQFLGAVTLDGKTADLYYCKGEPTIIARFSDEGGDYASGLCFGKVAIAKMINGDNICNQFLGVAYLLAMAQNLNMHDKYSMSEKSLVELIQSV